MTKNKMLELKINIINNAGIQDEASIEEIINDNLNNLDELSMKIVILTHFDDFIAINQDIRYYLILLIDKLYNYKSVDTVNLKLSIDTIKSFEDLDDITKCISSNRAIETLINTLDEYIVLNKNNININELKNIISCLYSIKNTRYFNNSNNTEISVFRKLDNLAFDIKYDKLKRVSNKLLKQKTYNK